MSNQSILFFDIETAANPENLALAPEPVIEAPANYKDPDKIAAYIADKTAAAKAEQIDRAALDPDYGKILCIGYALGPDKPIIVNAVGDEYTVDENDPNAKEPDPALVKTYAVTEADLLHKFWKLFSSCRGACVGFNILSFDLPYLMARSMYLGVQVPFRPILAKFRTEPVTDLYAIRYNWGPGKSLKQMAKLLKLEVLAPDVDGSMVKDLTPEQLRAYQASDVDLLQKLFAKMNGIYFNL